MEKDPVVIEKYFRANRSKEMKTKNLLKFFLFLEEDCNMKGLCVILEILHFSLLSCWPFSQSKNSLLWRKGEKGKGRRLLF